ncbi:hypothetical protein J4558_00820 [Leptolyngbya sp. 15MV]|nr:hypothetical protein J4558_00820 [Leptolyngbya sp. 15MV]
MAHHFTNRMHCILCIAALAVWVALGWPFLHELATGAVRRTSPVPLHWLLPYGLFGTAVFGATLLKPGPVLRWSLLGVQLAAVATMTVTFPKDLMSLFLIIIAWQVAMATTTAKALGWAVFQSLVIVGIVTQAPDSHLSYIVALSFVLQLCTIFTAQALRREEEASRVLSQANRELRAAQEVIAANVRDGERLRISRELHDAWGNELTALRLQLEIAGQSAERDRAGDHVTRARGLARALLAKVRGVVATLREAERDGHGGRLNRSGAHSAAAPFTSHDPGSRHHWIFCGAALAVTLALAFPVLLSFTSGTVSVSPLWLGAFALFLGALLVAMMFRPRPALHWALLGVQVIAVAAMAYIASWAMMSSFLILVAWQVAMATGPTRALAWVALQMMLVVAVIAVAPKPDLCWVLGKSFALQLFFVFAAQALRREAQTSRALGRTNAELRAAQAVIANSVRDAERLRISRELHDAWGHQLTALGLQLEIASHIAEAEKANEHVAQAKGLADALLGNVRDVVSALREAERGDLRDALETLAQNVPVPAIHVNIAPGLRVTPDQSHALIRCAQEAVTNAVRHADAANFFLEVSSDGDGIRLVARNDGSAHTTTPAAGSGLLGMRERLEQLGGRLAAGPSVGFGFTVDAWLPLRTAQAA